VHPTLEVQGKWRDGLIVSEPCAKAMLVILHYVRSTVGGFDCRHPLFRLAAIRRLPAKATNIFIGDGLLGHISSGCAV
jgi:hypothetical protein